MRMRKFVGFIQALVTAMCGVFILSSIGLCEQGGCTISECFIRILLATIVLAINIFTYICLEKRGYYND